ncbi:MAG: hypothetical protein NC908_04910 [Candidatus Omnitrophica bacterium]|nr:hypothetical protein [Candidatus Omnitrophota bacterium]
MDKKDIYEHLAKIYLDASLKRKNKERFWSTKNIFLISVVILFAVIAFVGLRFNKKFSHLDSNIVFILRPDVVKINFIFDPTKKEIYSINLNSMNLTKFKALEFSAKKANYQDNISLRVEFINSFKE